MRLARYLRRAGTRGLFVSATGTGKTLVSIRAADELGARLVLFVVPTLDLAAQTALAWRRDGHLEHMVIVSSLDTSGRDDLVAALGHVDHKPARAGRADVGGGGGGGPDPCVDGDLHLRLPGQDRADPAHGIRGAAVRPRGHGRGTPDRGPRGQEVGDRQRRAADPRGPPSLHDRPPASSPPPNWPSPPTSPVRAATAPWERTRTRSPTPWTTKPSTARRSSNIPSPRRWKTAGQRTTASWCPPSPTPTCAAA